MVGDADWGWCLLAAAGGESGHGSGIAIALMCILAFGVGSQLLAVRLRVPSILLLLGAGILAGPVTGLVHPEVLLQDLMFPFVSMCVSIILFEGALSLRSSEWKEIGRPLVLLLTLGVAITWGMTTLAALVILQFELFPSLLLGAILVVTGPTVIGPMLRQIRPLGRVGPIARWEGIIIDPVGAVLAVLVFEAHRLLQQGGVEQGTGAAMWALLLTIIVGLTVGVGTALLLAAMLKRHVIPDHLESPTTLALVISAFTVSNLVQAESGLVTVTIMGVVLANSGASLRHIVEFKENLSVLLISSLFVLLAARLELADFTSLGWRGPAFVAVMILLVRPMSIFASLAGTGIQMKEQIFLAWLAPRGIVAAAVASVFALQLGPSGDGLVSATFLLIIGTVVVYGLTTPMLARWLGLSSANPQGVLIVGANRFATEFAQAIQQAGFPVLLVDANPIQTRTARMQGLRTSSLNILSDRAIEELDLGGIGRYLGLTANDEVNSLGGLHFAELFGRANVFQLTPVVAVEKKKDAAAAHLRLRFLFGKEATFDSLTRRMDAGQVIKLSKLSNAYTWEQFQATYPDALLLGTAQQRTLTLATEERKIQPQPGQTLISLVTPQPEKKDATDEAT
ncbi:MAG: sodium:proton antiporter [Planctomycetaceae bacterium]|nr:sodium:proton antiporter [Planctomycetaceae bacterium]